MKKILILLFSTLISFNSYASIGDTYFCEEKEYSHGTKAQLILEWNENSMTDKSIPNESLGDTSHTAPFVINRNNYFVATIPYSEGQLVETFDGETYTTLYVSNSYTYVSKHPAFGGNPENITFDLI